MTDRDAGFFDPKIEAIEREHALWLELHAKLSDFLGVIDPYTVGQLSLKGEWYLDIRGVDLVYRNRWGHALHEPIEVALFLINDGEPFGRSISDDPKCSVIVAPNGVIEIENPLDLSEGEVLNPARHLTEAEITSLMADLEDLETRGTVTDES